MHILYAICLFKFIVSRILSSCHVSAKPMHHKVDPYFSMRYFHRSFVDPLSTRWRPRPTQPLLQRLVHEGHSSTSTVRLQRRVPGLLQLPARLQAVSATSRPVFFAKVPIHVCCVDHVHEIPIYRFRIRIVIHLFCQCNNGNVNTLLYSY